MAGNPFHFNKPTRPENFLGRSAVVNRIVDDLYDLSGDSYGIVGGRRFGKSSLLMALEDQLVKRLKQAKSGELCVLPVFVSPKSIELTAPSDVFGLILHKVKQVTSGKELPVSHEPHLDLGQPEYSAVNPLPATLQELENTIATLCAAYQPIGDLRFALLIDEVDCAVDYAWTDALFGMLRSLIHDGPVCDYARLVLAGAGRYLEVKASGSPLLNALKTCFLEPFAQDTARELVNRAVGISTEVADEVILQGGGHPFILQHLLHYLVEGSIASATLESVQVEVGRFRRDRFADLEGWWHTIGEDGRRVYGILARATDWTTHADLGHALNDPALNLDRGLNALCYHGLAVHDGTFQRYRISGQLFRDWVLPKCQAFTKQAQGAGSSTSVSQQAGAGSSQFGQVTNSPITIYQGGSPRSGLIIDVAKAARLRPVVDILMEYFDREEFRTLCFYIGVKYDSLEPGGIEIQAVQLVEGCDHAGHLEVLLTEIRRSRPAVCERYPTIFHQP
jgi:hypothetical protein